MRTRTQPPKAATWLLRHFGSSPNNEAVVGDLAERFQNRGTWLWYWRQVLTAIVVSTFRTVTSNKRLTAQSVAVGWGVLILFIFLIAPLEELLSGLASWSRYWRHEWIRPVGLITFMLVMCSVCGWAVARASGSRRAIVLTYAGSVFVYALAFFCYGLYDALERDSLADGWELLRVTALGIGMNCAGCVAIILGGLFTSRRRSIPDPYLFSLRARGGDRRYD